MLAINHHNGDCNRHNSYYAQLFGCYLFVLYCVRLLASAGTKFFGYVDEHLFKFLIAHFLD